LLRVFVAYGLYRDAVELPRKRLQQELKALSHSLENPAPKPSSIPDKYRNEATTDLKAKISSGANDLKFELN